MENHLPPFLGACDESGERSRRSTLREVNGYTFDEERDLIGKGAYGVVYKALDLRSNTPVALKYIFPHCQASRTANGATRQAPTDLNPGSNVSDISSEAIRELLVLTRSSHPSIVGLLGYFFVEQTICIVLEWCDSGDLSRFLSTLDGNRVSDPALLVHYASQLLHGLAYLHQRNLSHRDLKPQNVLVTQCGEVMKLGDFGLSRLEEIAVKKYRHEALTLWYRPPDVILGNLTFSFTADLWSIGCILAEMATGVVLMENHAGKEMQLGRIFSQLGEPTCENFPSMRQYVNYAAQRALLPKKMMRRYDMQLEASARPAYEALGAHRRGTGSPPQLGAVGRWYYSRPNLTGSGEALREQKRHLTAFFERHHAMPVIREDGVDLIARLLAYEPQQRISAEDALFHPFFSQLVAPLAIGGGSDRCK